MNHFIRSIAALLLSVCVIQGAWAQFFFTGPGFLPDENGTNLDDPQAKKVSPNVAAVTIIKDCAECPEMVVIPAGSFVMGSEKNASEQPRHKVEIRSFLIGKTEVTQKQWVNLMGSNPSRFSACGPECPVENISWVDVQQFIAKLNQKTGKKYRLPSEAEWEYAARAGTTTEWSFGSNESNLGGYAWYDGNSGRKTQIVGKKLPNAFGLFDVHGNVWEWTQDCWHDSYAGAPTDGSGWTMNCTGNFRVLRGGSWYDFPADLTAANRTRNFPDIPNLVYGFRLARDTFITKFANEPAGPERSARLTETGEAPPKLGTAPWEQEYEEEVSVKLTIVPTYAASIQAAIRPNITFDANTVTGNPAVEILVGLKPDGSITNITTVKSSGVRSWDLAAMRALEKTDRLPKDENGRVPPNLLITLRPRER